MRRTGRWRRTTLRRRLLLAALMLSWPYALPATAGDSASTRSIATNRTFDALSPPVGSEGQRATLLQAGYELGGWRIHVAGVAIDGSTLVRLASQPSEEPLLRVVREGLRRPVDLDDFLLFLDDILVAGALGLRGELVWVTPSRARNVGIFLHPDDIFEQKPRRYGIRGALSIDRPKPQLEFPVAKDGEVLGPNWTMRYRNPQSEGELLAALAAENDTGDFAERIESLMSQLRAQGADVVLNSTVRSRERCYLMWGAFILSRKTEREELLSGVAKLESAHTRWKLDVPIRWQHPAGWEATRQAAHKMADTYNVVYATEDGARASNHYGGHAIDLTALALPRQLKLRGSDGVARSFNLSDAHHPRDLNLSAELIQWVEVHFEFEKLKSDYPHWNDAAR